MAHSKNFAVVVGWLALLGCSGTDAGGGTGGAIGTIGGGAQGGSTQGGTRAAGGNGLGGTGTASSSVGSSATGGAASGGNPATGGMLTGGAKSTAQGGTGTATTVTSAGGLNAVGGTRAAGGATATAGNPSTGGSKSTSGTLATGGTQAVGGTKATGGTVAAGGATTAAAGGTSNNAGATSTGGASAGLPVGHCGAKKGRYFPATSWIYTDITGAPLRSNSAAMTAWLEDAGGWGNNNRFQIDTSFVVLDADASTPRVAPSTNDPLEYSSDCDPNVQMPVPANGRIEGYDDYVCPGRVTGDPAGDCHMLVADFASNTLSEAYQATYSGGSFYSTCTIAWNMTKDAWGAPPAAGSTLPSVGQRNWGIGRDCTGPDAAGFPIAPLLFTIGDVLSGRVEHAIRFTLPNSRMQRAAKDGDPEPAYVWPATHAGGPQAYDPDAPIYGSRWRLKPDFDPASRGLDPNNAVVKAVVYGLQHYGMLLSDGGEIALMAEDASDCATTWDDLWGSSGSRVLNGIRPSDFDVLDTGSSEGGWDCERNTR